VEPWREQLLERLRAYGDQPLAAEERVMLAEFGPFVSAHPDCLRRTCGPGHLTASAWVVDVARERTLLLHHRKLDRWLQPGGHVDGDPDLLASALREAQEETGLRHLVPVSPEIFDVDRHWIPERKAEPGHWHYDLRFLIEGDPEEALTVNSESKALRWVKLKVVAELNPEESMFRLVRKTVGLESFS
jgi:8-oxo-dGTP pyrophosphatase MutT (NUDIX family)